MNADKAGAVDNYILTQREKLIGICNVNNTCLLVGKLVGQFEKNEKK